MSARDLSLSRIFGMPLLLGVLTAIGLLAGLLGEGPWKWVCWAGLGIPALVMGYYVLRAER